jgi:hypothetical protein
LTTTTGVALGTSGSLTQGANTRIDSSGNGSFGSVTASSDVIATSNIKTGSFGGTTRIDSSGNGTFATLTFGGSSALVQGSTTRISTSGNATFGTIDGTTITGSTAVVAGIFDISGGYFGQDRTGGLALALAGGGTCTIYFKGGILYAASGC